VNALKETSVNIVQAAMGHASVATTGRYLRPDEETLSKAMEKMKVL
jgi:integrase